MTMNPNDSNDKALSRALQEWKVDAALPPRFEEGVWRRIERAEGTESVWRLALQRITAALARPSLATGYVTVVLLIGAGAGYWKAQTVNARADESLSARYVQMVDPYQMPRR